MRLWARARRFIDEALSKVSDYHRARRALYEATKDKQFSADDFRDLGIHAEMGWDPQKTFRNFFGRLSQEGLVEQIGRIKSRHPSNYGRKFGLYIWTEKAHKLFG